MSDNITKTLYRIILLNSLFFLFLTASFPSLLRAHESRPLYIEINEIKPDTFSVNIKTPGTIPYFNIPKLVIPEKCTAIREKITVRERGSYLTNYDIKCEGSISGRELNIEFPVLNPSVTTIVRLEYLSGQNHSKLLRPGELSWELPATESRLGVAREYTLLGMSHIWEGIDHLLFLLCLIFIAGTGRRILITVTGFTIAHSVTLVLSTLNVIKLPVAPVEAAIALSIVFVAYEIARGRKDSLTYRYPIAVSSSFGLLHGFGFASVLNQIGLPQVEIPTSLLFFNIGVEIGQLVFIAAVIFLAFLLKLIFRQPIIGLLKYDKAAAYIIGSVASLWMFERIYSFWF